MTKPVAKIGANDRLGMTLLLASMLHAVAALGITFEAEAPGANEIPDLDVILVQSKSDEAPEVADFIAQANQKGGGDSEQKLRPSDLFSTPVPKPEPGIAPMPVTAVEETSQREQTLETEVLTVRRNEASVATQTSQAAVPEAQNPLNNEIAQREMEMANLQAEINRTRQAYAKRPKENLFPPIRKRTAMPSTCSHGSQK